MGRDRAPASRPVVSNTPGLKFNIGQVDPDIAATVSPTTLAKYQDAVSSFYAFLKHNHLQIEHLMDIDGMIMIFKNHEQISRSQLEYLIAALLFFFPPLRKYGLEYSRKAAAGKAGAHQTKHTVPLVGVGCKYFGVVLATNGNARMGFGIALQQATALRPAELRALTPEHVLVPEGGVGRYIIRLGANVGTKVKREQWAVLDSHKHTDLAWLLLMLLKCTMPTEKLFPFSYAKYHRALKQVEEALGIDLGVTPHSPRAGYASEEAAAGTPVLEIMRGGRWGSESSMKTYVDIIVASQVTSMIALGAHAAPMRSAADNFYRFFRPSLFVASATNGAEGLREVWRCLGAEGMPASGGLWEDFETFAGRHTTIDVKPFAHGSAKDQPRFWTSASQGKPCSISGKGDSKGAKGSSKGSEGKGCSQRRIPKAFR